VQSGMANNLNPTGDVSCREVWSSVSHYLDGTLAPELRERIEEHIPSCTRCKAVLQGSGNIKDLLANDHAFDVPRGFSRRLYTKLEEHLKPKEEVAPPNEIAVGITDDNVPLGSHLIYFWDNDDTFERGIRFLYPGIGQGEHCIVFGHDEAVEKVLSTLRAAGYDPDQLIRNLELTVIPRRHAAKQTVADISDVVQAALRAGAKAVRFLGNLGMGLDTLPAGEDDVLDLECQADALIQGAPCVIVCMYDLRTLSGRLIVKGGLHTHHLTVSSEGVQKNPYYSPDPTAEHRRHV